MISFLKFLEEQEKTKQTSYIDALGDELGIEPENFYKEPQYASFFSFGKNGYNLGAYSIERFKRNADGEITHAVVVLNNDKAIKNKKYITNKDSIFQIKKDSLNNRFVVPIEDLEKLMTQGTQQQQPPSDAM